MLRSSYTVNFPFVDLATNKYNTIAQFKLPFRISQKKNT